MVLGLFSVRIVLGALGETNYGIYSLVAGVVSMLGLLQGAMSNASMRFMAHSLGSKDEQLIRKTFNTTLFLHFVIGIAVVIIIELGGIFMFEYLLNIPADKIRDAKVIYHFMTITTFITIIAVPYDSVINSHENLLFLSIVDVAGAILKFGVALYLTVSHLNLLILYGFLLMLIQIILRGIKQYYSQKKYQECKISLRQNYDKSLAKTILSFTGWNLFGSIASMSVTQVRSILLNMFFGVGLNAANGIAMQVTGQVNAVSSSMTQALNPQLVKSEGGGDRERMIRLTELATKYSVFLFSLFAIPVIIEMPYLFSLWLKKVPDFAVIFSRLILIGLLIDKFSFEITSAIRAVGDIKGLTVVEAIIGLTNIPVAYILFKFGFAPYSIYVLIIIIGSFAFINRLYYAKRIVKMDIIAFLKNGIIVITLILIFSTGVTYLVHYYLIESFIRLIIITIFFTFTFSLMFWLFGMSGIEKLRVKGLLNSIINRN